MDSTEIIRNAGDVVARATERIAALQAENTRLHDLLVRAALGQEPQIRAYHDPLCGACLGCQARAALQVK